MPLVAIVDTETTGLAAEDEPISLGLIVCLVDDRGNLLSEVGRYYGTQAPTRPIHPVAQRVHGMSAASLQGTLFDRNAISQLLAQPVVLVAHNASFDARMLAQVLSHAHCEWRCTLRQFPWPSSGGKKLDDVCRKFGISRRYPHNSLSDCEALLACLLFRTGKTHRSRTHLGRLLRCEAYLVGVHPQFSQLSPMIVKPSNWLPSPAAVRVRETLSADVFADTLPQQRFGLAPITERPKRGVLAVWFRELADKLLGNGR